MRNIIGLYGLVGTGKTTISNFFKNHHWNSINQDFLGHEVLQEYPQEISKIFGKEILENNIINRKILGQKVFSNALLLDKLMEFSYPIIIDKTLQILNNNKNPTIIEGALFYKVRELIPHTHLMYVEVLLPVLHTRLLARGHSLEWIKKVLFHQKEIIQAKSLADIIIDNSDTIEYLNKQLDAFLQKLR